MLQKNFLKVSSISEISIVIGYILSKPFQQKKFVLLGGLLEGKWITYLDVYESFFCFFAHECFTSIKGKRKKENSVGSIDSKAAVAMWFSHHKVAKIVCKVSYAGLSPQFSAALLLSLLYFSSPSTLQNTNFCYCEKKTHESRFSSTTSSSTPCHLKLSAYLPLL